MTKLIDLFPPVDKKKIDKMTPVKDPSYTWHEVILEKHLENGDVVSCAVELRHVIDKIDKAEKEFAEKKAEHRDSMKELVAERDRLIDWASKQMAVESTRQRAEWFLDPESGKYLCMVEPHDKDYKSLGYRLLAVQDKPPFGQEVLPLEHAEKGKKDTFSEDETPMADVDADPLDHVLGMSDLDDEG